MKQPFIKYLFLIPCFASSVQGMTLDDYLNSNNNINTAHKDASPTGYIDALELNLSHDTTHKATTYEFKMVPNSPGEMRLRQSVIESQNNLNTLAAQYREAEAKKTKLALLCDLAYWQESLKLHTQSLKILEKKTDVLIKMNDTATLVSNLPKIEFDQQHHNLELKAIERKIADLQQQIAAITGKPLSETLEFLPSQLIESADMETVMKTPGFIENESTQEPSLQIKQQEQKKAADTLALDDDRNSRILSFVGMSLTPSEDFSSKKREFKIGLAFPISSRKSFDESEKKLNLLQAQDQLNQDLWKTQVDNRHKWDSLKQLIAEQRDLDTAAKQDSSFHKKTERLSAYRPLLKIDDELLDLELSLKIQEKLRESRLLFLDLVHSSPEIKSIGVSHYILKNHEDHKL